MAQQPATMSAALGAEEYRALYEMSISDDATVRAQASELAKKLTPSESQEFADFQTQLHRARGNPELHRVDNAIGGVPPELAVTGVLGIGRAVAGAGLSGASRIVAGAKAAVEQAAPAVKYEATKTILEKMGVPTPMAIATAIAVSGYRKGAKAEPTPAATRAAPAAAPPAATPAAAAPSVPSPAPTLPATTVPRNLGKALKTLLTEGGLKLEEANQAVKWINEGVPLETIQDRIQAARQLAGKPAFVKLPSSADVAAAVKDRNATGHWPEGQP